MRIALDCILTQMGALQLSQKDEEILAHLTDIECEELEPTEDEDGDELAGFKLTFHFSKNANFDHESLVGCPATVQRTRKALPTLRGLGDYSSRKPCVTWFYYMHLCGTMAFKLQQVCSAALVILTQGQCWLLLNLGGLLCTSAGRFLGGHSFLLCLPMSVSER